MNWFGCKGLFLHCRRIDRIPFSEDELRCMREAQYHSAAAASMQAPQTTPSQLDPGSLYDPSRRSGTGIRPTASGGGKSASGGANLLLKQAIANRMKPGAVDGGSKDDRPGPSTSLDAKKQDEEMNQSLLMNPAWYRDHDGRTGFKPKELDGAANEQKSPVKENRKPEEPVGKGVDAIDTDLFLTEAELKAKRKQQRREVRAARAQLDVAMETLEEAGATSEPGDDPDRKLSKEEKKALKEQEKADKKKEKELEKERAKEEKIKKKEQKKLEKEEKKRKSTTSLNSEGNESSAIQKSETLASGETSEEALAKKKKDKSSKKPDVADLGLSDEAKAKLSKEQRKALKKLENQKSEGELSVTSGKSVDSKKEDVDKKKKDSKKSGKEMLQRSDSIDSAASSTKSTATVREATKEEKEKKQANIHPSGKPPKGSPKTPLSPQTSSPDDDNLSQLTGGSRTTAKDRRPKKENIGERRDSSLSESSRVSGVSHKSVTFSNKIQMHEIERHDYEISSEEDDAAIMSDDELAKPDSERRRRLVRILQNQEEAERDLLQRRPENLDIDYDYDEDDDDFEEVERAILQEAQERGDIPQGYPVYDVDSGSQNSFYAEDQDPDRYIMDEEGSYISLDHLPTSVRRAIAAEMRSRGASVNRSDYDNNGQLFGSMSRLHADDGSNQPSLLLHAPQPQLPRSASGYLEEPYMMQNSYQQAVYPGAGPGSGAFHHDSKPSGNSLNEPSKKLQESYYDNVHGKVPSRTNSLTGPLPRGAGSTGVDNRRNSTIAITIGASDSSSSTPVPTPPRGSSTSIDRAAFFESGKARDDSATPTPSPPRHSPATVAAAPPPQRILITSTTTTTETLLNRQEVLERVEAARGAGTAPTNEDEMRRQFVRKFGARRAPMAEEDPTDPGPSMGSQESVLSSDSRESVVSAASIKTESTIRRGFNY